MGSQIGSSRWARPMPAWCWLSTAPFVHLGAPGCCGLLKRANYMSFYAKGGSAVPTAASGGQPAKCPKRTIRHNAAENMLAERLQGGLWDEPHLQGSRCCSHPCRQCCRIGNRLRADRFARRLYPPNHCHCFSVAPTSQPAANATTAIPTKPKTSITVSGHRCCGSNRLIPAIYHAMLPCRRLALMPASPAKLG